MSKISKREWLDCQKWEKESWGSDIYVTPTNGEVRKQNSYAVYMGLSEPEDQLTLSASEGLNIDLGNKSVLDVGCGPVSMLLRSSNFSRAVGVEPLDYGSDVNQAYSNQGIELMRIPAEEMSFSALEFDEVWMYNVLQHTYDPEAILQNIKGVGKVLRIFEWIDTNVHKGHPQVMATSDFVRALDLDSHEFQVKTFNPVATPGLSGKAIIVTKKLVTDEVFGHHYEGDRLITED